MTAHNSHHIETKLIHAGEPEPLIHGAVSMPIFQSSTFEYAGQDSYDPGSGDYLVISFWEILVKEGSA